MQIVYLADHMEYVSELAELHFSEWSYLNPGESIEQRITRLRGYCGRRAIPTVVVAVAGREVLGTAMLLHKDMDCHPELTPWLAGVFVKKTYRRMGIGAALVKHVESEAAALEVQRLYLYTPQSENFYRELGWSVEDRCSYKGTNVVVMSKALGA